MFYIASQSYVNHKKSFASQKKSVVNHEKSQEIIDTLSMISDIRNHVILISVSVQPLAGMYRLYLQLKPSPHHVPEISGIFATWIKKKVSNSGGNLDKIIVTR